MTGQEAREGCSSRKLERLLELVFVTVVTKVAVAGIDHYQPSYALSVQRSC